MRAAARDLRRVRFQRLAFQSPGRIDRNPQVAQDRGCHDGLVDHAGLLARGFETGTVEEGEDLPLVRRLAAVVLMQAAVIGRDDDQPGLVLVLRTLLHDHP